jgi:AP-2 complex subunit alpha
VFELTAWQVSVDLKLPVLLNKFLQAVPVSANDFVGRWRALAGPPTKLQEVVGISSSCCG